MKKLSGTTFAYVGFVLFLLGFLSLGLFVAGLALGSSLAVLAGVVVVAAFAASYAEFRISRGRAGGAWSKPETKAEMNRYRSRYRHAPR